MNELDDDSVALIVTSPPYGAIKDYGTCDQIGFGSEFDEYFTRLEKVWRECYRVLGGQCRMAINVGDQYLRAKDYGRYHILPISSIIVNQCTRLGMDFLGDIIWKKISTTNTTGGCSLMGSLFYPRNGLITYDYEHILLFKKVDGKEKDVPRDIKELSKISMEEWKTWYTGHWTFPGIQQREHVAMFPEELPYRLIRMFSFIGDVILDPFSGSGTTLKVARALSRRSVGYEINPDFLPVMKIKIEEPFEPRDFHAILKKISAQVGDNVQLDFNFSTQKSVTCIYNADDDARIVIDYCKLPAFVSRDELQEILDRKFDENNVRNFLSKTKSWNDITCYVIVFEYNGNDENSMQFINNYFIDKSVGKIIAFDFNEFISSQFDIKRLNRTH